MTTKVMKEAILGGAVLVSAAIGLMTSATAQARGGELRSQHYHFGRQLDAAAPNRGITTALNQPLLNTVCVRNRRCPNVGDPTSALLLLG